MSKPKRRGGSLLALFTASSAALAAMTTPSQATINIVQNSTSSWSISNGNLSVNFDPKTNNITTLSINGSANVLDPKKSEIYPELTGTPFVSGTSTAGFQEGASGNYIDFWNTTASGGANPVTYSFHYVMYNNDPNISVYEVISHSPTDPATNLIVQGQFLARIDPTQFFNSVQENVSVNNPGAQTSVIQNPYLFPTQSGRTVQDSTTDLSGSTFPGDWGSNVYTKYDYSSYTQFLQANTEYGPNYSVSTIFTSPDSMNGGPTKQNLQYTNNIAMIEFLSAHYGDANYEYIPQQGVQTSRLYGPYDFSFNSVSGQSGATLEQNAINSMPALDADYNADTELLANGYIPTTSSARSTVAITATSTAGWSSNANNNTAVLSDPHVSMQNSGNGYQYWAQLPNLVGTTNTAGASINNVAPGMYRLTLYQLGQWGETRIDGVQTVGGITDIPSNLKFIPENFGNAAPIWTIGTPDRSDHEFLNGSASAANTGVVTGGDLRQYYGDYDYWAEEQTLGNPGRVVYYATAVGSTPATNNPLKWIGNQWEKFNPGLYDSSNNTTDEYTKIAPAYVTAGGGPGTYTGLPWVVNFTTTTAQSNQGSFVDLSVGLASTEANLTVTLNGHSETWYTGTSNTDGMTRSGDAGVYQMVVFEWPVADLVAAGSQDQFTFSVNTTDGDMYDALRMEISSTGAAPGVTGWHDYWYVNSSNVQTNADDVLPTNVPMWNLNGSGSWATTGDWTSAIPNGRGATADLSSAPGITTAASISLDGTRTLGALVLNNSVGGSSNSYTITQGTGSGTLILDNGSSNALIDDEAGNQLISAPITLNSDASVSVAGSTNNLTLSGAINGTGRLLVSGAGTVSLTGTNTYTGDTAVNSGTFSLASTGQIASPNILIAAGAVFADAGTISNTTNLTNNGTSNFTAASSTVATLNGSGTLNLNPTVLTVTGGGTFTGPISGTGTLVAGGSTLTLSGAISSSFLTASQSATLNINGSISATTAVTSLGSINIRANTGTTGPAAVTMASLTIGPAGLVTLNSATSHSNRTVLVLGSLTFQDSAAPTALLNLRDNDLIVHNGSLSNITSAIAAASNSGLWNGATGITSSIAANTHNTTLAVIQNDNGAGTNTKLFATFDGQTVVDSDVLVKYTYDGDADLSGTITASDYLLIDNGFNSGGTLTGWRNGDFNYDNAINGDDYTLIDNAFNTQGSVSLAAVGTPTEMIANDTTQIATPVPEPMRLSLLMLGIGLLDSGRRRTRRA